MSEGTFAIVLAVPDELSLLVIADRLTKVGIKFIEVHEPDPPHNGALMAIGVVPGLRSVVGRYLSDLPKFRGSTLLESSKCKDATRKRENGGSNPSSSANSRGVSSV